VDTAKQKEKEDLESCSLAHFCMYILKQHLSGVGDTKFEFIMSKEKEYIRISNSENHRLFTDTLVMRVLTRDSQKEKKSMEILRHRSM
jgi:hypothetical protein